MPKAKTWQEQAREEERRQIKALQDRHAEQVANRMLPSDVYNLFDEYSRTLVLSLGVAIDTETSGLFGDDGARVSTASMAWVVHDHHADGFAQMLKDNGTTNVTFGEEEVAPDLKFWIASVAWPFDQGTEGKPEDNGQTKLWADAENLDQDEWMHFLAALDLAQHHVYQNAKFDLEKIRLGVRRWPNVGESYVGKNIWDTQLVSQMLWPLEPTSLKPTCARIFGKQWADEGAAVKKYLSKSKLPAGRWDLMPWDVIAKYADTDARITLMLKLRQEWEILYNNGASWFYDKVSDEERAQREAHGLDDRDYVFDAVIRRTDVMRVLANMEERGLPYDEVGSREAAIECKKRAREVAKELPYAPTTNAAKDYYFTDAKPEYLDMIPYEVTAKGAPSLTAEVLERMVNDRVPHAGTFAKYRKVTTAASMWYEGYADAMGTDGRLRTYFRQLGTRSMRFSVERINLQAIPQDYRLSGFDILDGIPTPRQLIAAAVPEGWRLYELDLAQAELRVGALFAKCVKMLDMINDGADLHTYTTKELFDMGPGHEQFDKYRQVGKRGNFSLIFGSGGTTFRKMVSKETGIILAPDEAERIVAEWNMLYPEFKGAIRRHMNRVEQRQAKHGYGWVDLPNGERRWFLHDEEAHKAFNQRVQGNLAQFGISWMLNTEKMLSNNHELARRAAADDVGGVGLVLTIHDSQVLLLPDDEFGNSLANECAEFGRSLWKIMFPGVPGEVDYHAWHYNADGTLGSV